MLARPTMMDGIRPDTALLVVAAARVGNWPNETVSENFMAV